MTISQKIAALQSESTDLLALLIEQLESDVTMRIKSSVVQINYKKLVLLGKVKAQVKIRRHTPVKLIEWKPDERKLVDHDIITVPELETRLNIFTFPEDEECCMLFFDPDRCTSIVVLIIEEEVELPTIVGF